MLKACLLFSLSLILLLPSGFGVALAKSSEGVQVIPEKDGTYSVSGRNDLKVRVFVHEPHFGPAKPGSSSLSQECGLGDPDSSSTVGLTGWHLPSGVWTYRLNINSVPSGVGSSNLAAIASRTFGQWQNNTNLLGKVFFVQGPTTSVSKARFDRQNIISWGRTSGTALAVTYTWYYTSGSLTGQVAEVDTIFNKNFVWGWNGTETTNCATLGVYDAQNILTHELGHWMGLDDEYANIYSNNTMYGYGSKTEVKKNTLTTGDINATNQIY